MLQLDFTPWKAQACDKYILLCENRKLVTIRFNSVKDSSMLQVNFTQWKAQACDK
jgi:hypothetical protein